MLDVSSEHASVVAAIYSAAGRPELWPETIETVAEYLGAMGGMLTYHNLRDNKAWIAIGRLSEDLTRLYTKEYVRNDYAYAFTRAPTGRALIGNAVADAAAVRRSAFHADILAPQRVTEIVAMVHPRLVDRSGAGGFAFMLDPNQSREVTRVAERLDLIAPHLTRAVDLTLEVGRHVAEGREIGRLLVALPTAAALVDPKGRLLQANAALERLLAERDGLSSRSGEDGLQLVAGTAAETRLLRGMIQQAATAAEGRLGRFRPAMRLTRPSGEASLVVVATPLPPLALPLRPMIEDGARALVQVLDPSRPGAGAAGILSQASGLTATEDRVATLVAQGLGVPEIARALGIAPNTVRTHLARCFAKTGTRSQVGLARLLAGLAA